ncbi:MAG: hypothetical protein L6Q94_04270, partial [Calditrichia bacterium]|nr:hypothetical protein [Calditrichia bacterium]
RPLSPTSKGFKKKLGTNSMFAAVRSQRKFFQIIIDLKNLQRPLSPTSKGFKKKLGTNSMFAAVRS